MKPTAVAVVLLVAAVEAYAQHQPYTGQQDREIKALSPQEVDEYRAGAGMSFAKAAELNHYPGPLHALELADKLGLSPEQRASTKQLMETHKAEARALGAKLMEAEGRLEALFRTGKVERSVLASAVAEAAALQGEYRLSHLETHRRMHGLLSAEQVARYDELRGYAKPAADQAVHRHK